MTGLKNEPDPASAAPQVPHARDPGTAPGAATAADTVGELGFPDVPRLELNQLLEQFVHAGMDDDVVSRVGDLPPDQGMLGLLISGPAPIRLADLAAHPASVGVPPGHPPMKGFAGVPIRIGDEVFGNLYLTERSAGGDFTAEDEDLAIALAAAVGAASATARRFTESEQRRRWLAASTELTSDLLSGKAAQPHVLITERAAAAAEADFAMLWVPQGAHQVSVTAVSGQLAAHQMSWTLPLTDSPPGRAIITGKSSLVTAEKGAATGDTLGADIGSMIVVPLAAGGQIRGALTLGRRAAGPEFGEPDLDMATSFASHAAVALELGQARAGQITLAQIADHDRIAADLHDHVIQELFALGMKLQGQVGRSDPRTAERVNGYVDTLDTVIGKIRTTIFGLQQPEPKPGDLTAQLLEIIDDHAPQLGFAADVRFAGPLSLTTDAALIQDVLAVTREALSNCARHAQASAVSVSVELQNGLITLDIVDDGRGLGIPGRSSGLTNMRHRAERNSGTLQLTTPASGGTHLIWTAALQN